MEILTGIIAFIILLPIIVFVHEFGHFIFARINGVKVESFSIGFGPSLFSWKDKHKTVWKVSAIPLGGYVKMLGQSDTPESTKRKTAKRKQLTKKDKAKSFEFKKNYQKASIVFAGPFFNYVFAFLVFFGLFFFKGISSQRFTIINVEKDSPAYISDLHNGDVILTVDDIKVKSAKSIPQLIQKSKGKEVKIGVKRDNKYVQIFVEPRKQDNKYMIGINYFVCTGGYESLGFFESLKTAYASVINITSDTLKALGEIITGTRSSKELGGMISIAKVSGNALSTGFYSFLYLMAVISVSLGLFNLFPIPVLDGGYLLIYIIEGIIKREIPEKVKQIIFLLGFIFVIFLLILSNFNDVVRIMK